MPLSMNRRNFVASAAAAVASPAISLAEPGAPTKPMFLELRKFLLRNTTDNQRGRAAEFVAKVYSPALQRETGAPVGVFNAAVAADSPFILVLAAYPTLNDFDRVQSKLWADGEFAAQAERALNGPLLYQRMEVSLLKGFPGFPGIEVPPQDAAKPGRLFELRMYESSTPLSLKKKIGMFEGGEIDIFRKSGLAPVFFGEQIAGGKMPNLTYMVAFDNAAAREANWGKFGGSPEWAKLRSTPGLSDGETVSNISNMLLSPAAGSQIR